MNPVLKQRDRLMATQDGALVEELDQMTANIRTGWKQQHNPDGTHRDITATSVTATGGVSTASATVTGTVTAGATTLSALTVTGASSLQGLTAGATTVGALGCDAVTGTSTIKERGRTVPLGEWTQVTYAGGNFTGSGSMTWTVDSTDIITYAYTLIGKTLCLIFIANTTTVAGTPSTQLRVAVPGGFSAAKINIVPCIFLESGVLNTGYAQVMASDTYVSVSKFSGNWAAATNTTSIYFSITFEVQ